MQIIHDHETLYLHATICAVCVGDVLNRLLRRFQRRFQFDIFSEDSLLQELNQETNDSPSERLEDPGRFG